MTICGIPIDQHGNPILDLPEAAHFYRCAACGGLVDKRDLGAVLEHEADGPHPVEMREQ